MARTVRNLLNGTTEVDSSLPSINEIEGILNGLEGVSIEETIERLEAAKAALEEAETKTKLLALVQKMVQETESANARAKKLEEGIQQTMTAYYRAIEEQKQQQEQLLLEQQRQERAMLEEQRRSYNRSLAQRIFSLTAAIDTEYEMPGK
jgi:poly(A) polymerase Pap1